MKKALILISIITVMVLAMACSAASPPAPPEQAQPDQAQPASTPEEKPAPAETAPEEPVEEKTQDFAGFPTTFSAVNLLGEDVNESIFADYDLTMINIWATYCEPCIMEMEYLGEMSAEMPEGTQLIGLVGDVMDAKTFDMAVSIAEETGADFTHLVPDKALYTYLYYNVMGFPTTVFVDSEGKLVGEQVIGMRTREQYETELQARLDTLEQRAGSNI